MRRDLLRAIAVLGGPRAALRHALHVAAAGAIVGFVVDGLMAMGPA